MKTFTQVKQAFESNVALGTLPAHQRVRVYKCDLAAQAFAQELLDLVPPGERRDTLLSKVLDLRAEYTAAVTDADQPEAKKYLGQPNEGKPVHDRKKENRKKA